MRQSLPKEGRFWMFLCRAQRGWGARPHKRLRPTPLCTTSSKMEYCVTKQTTVVCVRSQNIPLAHVLSPFSAHFLFPNVCHKYCSRFIEAPVSGSKGPAATGTLIFLCAGSKELFDEVVDGDLTAMGKASHFFGTEVGAGTRAKLVVNSLMGTMLAAYSEGLNLAESVGLDGNTMVEVIGQGAIASPMFALKGPKMLVNDHSPNFPLKHASKDMTLASEMAKKAGVKYAVMDQAEELFRKATGDEELNVADEDFSAVMALVQKESSTNSN